MNKTLKKTLGIILSLGMTATSVVLPTAASAAEIGKIWRFDFGTSENTETDWIAVTKDDVYAENGSKSPVQYGFLGTDGHGDSYGQYVDGVVTKEGQNVTLKSGAKSTVAIASDDYLGIDKEATVAESKIDGDYPIRFAMKAESDSYYNVKVKLTTFDQTAAATASVFSERHHAIILEEAIAAGAEKEVEFNTTIQPFYLKDSKATYNDDMLNVVVVGNNVAVESIVIEKINPLPTVWMYNDSTGCDYQISQPFFMLQNYGGTGSFLSKYFPKDIVAVNQGEGGLNAADNPHWDCAKAHIGAGDYVYVQYGHNHKNDSTVAPGTLGYLESIPKYYEQAHSVGAYTLYVGPIDRHNASQYNAATNTWSSTLGGFSKAAKYYTEILITAGKAKADEFVTKAKQDAGSGVSVVDDTYAWADDIIAQGITANGVTDVAFIDLNQPTLDWLEEVCESVKTIRGAANYERNATDYYFYSMKGTAVDGTHCNTAGADNTASFFFDEAQKTIALSSSSTAAANEKAIAAVEADVLTPLVTSMRTTTDNAYVVPENIIKAGVAPNSVWPTVYVPSSLPALPLVIKDIQFGDDGKVESASIYRQDAEKSITTYGILDIEIKDSEGTTKGHIYSKQIEPTGTNNATFTYTAADFTTYRPADLTLGETDTYTAVVRSASDPGDGTIVIDTGEAADTYSAVYEPTDVETDLLVDDLNYYGASTGDDIITKGWSFIGSGSGTGNHLLTKESDKAYTEIVANGGGSYYLWKNFDITDPGMTTEGRYMFEGSFNYTSGAGSVVSFVIGTDNNHRSGTERLPLFTIGTNGIVTAGTTATEAGTLNQGVWTDIKAIVDTDLGILSVSVGGGTAAVIELENYQTTSTEVTPAKLTQIHFGGDRQTYSYKVTNLHVAKLKNQTLPTKTITVSSNDNAKGTVSVSGANATGVAIGYNDGTATVKADKAMAVYLIEAKYTGNALTEIVPTKMEFAAAGTKTQTVTPGSKLMVWKTLESMEPVVDAITATGTVPLPADNEVTDAINTVTTVTATPAQGSVFMGWYDNSELTGNPVSMDNPYTFRLRDDTTLTAKFVKEPSVTDVTNYSIAADRQNIKAVSGATFNVNIEDAVDSASTPISVANTAVAWESQTAGVTVADGVVTIGNDFAISAGEIKPITIKATVNNIVKTCTVNAHLYDYYENFDGGDVSKMNWFTNLGAGKIEVKDGALAITSQNNNNNTYSGTHFAVPADVIDKLVTIKLDYKTSSVGSGNTTSHWFLTNLALTDNSPTYAETYSQGKGVSFQNASDGLAIAANTKYVVTIVINNKTKTAEVTAAPESGSPVTYSIADTKQPINTIYFRPGRNLTDTIDNVSVVIADAPTE